MGKKEAEKVLLFMAGGLEQRNLGQDPEAKAILIPATASRRC